MVCSRVNRILSSMIGVILGSRGSNLLAGIRDRLVTGSLESMLARGVSNLLEGKRKICLGRSSALGGQLG